MVKRLKVSSVLSVPLLFDPYTDSLAPSGTRRVPQLLDGG